MKSNISLDRRDLLKVTLSTLALAGLGSLRSVGRLAEVIAERIWHIDSDATLVAGSDSVFDLSQTLPAHLRRGGTFAVDSSGRPLPAGMSLDPRGFLFVGEAAPGTTEGLVFSYAEPA